MGRSYICSMEDEDCPGCKVCEDWDEEEEECTDSSEVGAEEV